MNVELKQYQAPVWNEPIIMEMGYPGRRGVLFPPAEPEVRRQAGDVSELIPSAMRRRNAPALPEMSEPEVLYHYLRLSQQTLGMMGISLFGTCTMKYNPQITSRWPGVPRSRNFTLCSMKTPCKARSRSCTTWT